MEGLTTQGVGVERWRQCWLRPAVDATPGLALRGGQPLAETQRGLSRGAAAQYPKHALTMSLDESLAWSVVCMGYLSWMWSLAVRVLLQ